MLIRHGVRKLFQTIPHSVSIIYAFFIFVLIPMSQEEPYETILFCIHDAAAALLVLNRCQFLTFGTHQTLEQKLAYGGQLVLRWMMDNIYIRTDPAGNIKPDKEKSTEKIDSAVATVMALDCAIRCGGRTSDLIYDERGLLIL